MINYDLLLFIHFPEGTKTIGLKYVPDKKAFLKKLEENSGGITIIWISFENGKVFESGIINSDKDSFN